MSSSMSLASKLTSSPHFQVPKSLSAPNKLTTKTTTLFQSSKPFSKSSIRCEKAPPCKALQTSTNNSAARVVNNEQWVQERETLLAQIQDLELKIQQLATKSSSGASENGSATATTTTTKPLEDILQEFYTLGVKIMELEPKNSGQTPISVTKALANIAQQLHVLAADDGLLKVEPKPTVGDNSRKIDQMVQDVVDLYYGEIDTPYYLTGNFGPIREETPPTSGLVINGQLPESINGMMLRVGPNPVFDPEANYRWLDGDGMVHAIRIKDGQATYAARYVRTSRFLQEDVFGQAEMFKYGDLEGSYGLFVAFAQFLRAKLEVLDMSFGYTTSNVGLIHHAGRIMALEDFGKPHVIHVKDDGDLETLGINDFNGKLNHTFTPHPKLDAETGEMFTFGSMHLPPYAIYRVVSPDGIMSDPVPITVPGPTYMHDFAITKNYAILMDNPYAFSPETMLLEDDWIFSFDATKKSRFGILPRYATSEEGIKWFEFDVPFFVFHNANAWEEDGDKVVLYCCKMDAAINPQTNKPYLAPATCCKGNATEGVTLTLPQLYKMTFNMSTGEATQEKLTETFVDNPKINVKNMGRKSRYVYTSEMASDSKIPAIIKYDLESESSPLEELKLELGENIFASEHVFVPRQSDTPIEEDDGYLINYVHDENIDKSFVYVIDAQKMETLATIELPSRVPYGFHSIYVTEEELQAQVKSLA